MLREDSQLGVSSLLARGSDSSQGLRMERSVYIVLPPSSLSPACFAARCAASPPETTKAELKHSPASPCRFPLSLLP